MEDKNYYREKVNERLKKSGQPKWEFPTTVVMIIVIGLCAIGFYLDFAIHLMS